MATYVSLVNDVLKRLNESTLDTAGDGFGSVRGVHALAKDAINSSIREILDYHQQWPFTLTTYTETLTVGDGSYALQSDAHEADFHSFYIKKHSTKENLPATLKLIGYDEYINKHRPSEDFNGSSGHTTPVYVYEAYDGSYGVSPLPDTDYEVEYRYWSYPTDLSNYSDTCVVPDRFKRVVIDGAMMYMYYHRRNEQAGVLHEKKFKKGMDDMRRLIVPADESIRSTVIKR